MIDSQGKLVRVSLDEEEEKVKTQALVKSSKLKREGTIRDPGRKEKNKRESFKKWYKKQEKEIDSLTSYPGPKYNTAQNIYKRFYKNILHIDKSQAMWIDTGTVCTRGEIPT